MNHVYAVIPTFNRYELTRRCVESLFRQKHRPLTVIVSDGGSTDDGLKMLRGEFKELKILESSKDLWWTRAMEKGIQWALKNGSSGDFLLMMNNDTEIPEDYLTVLMQEAKKNQGCVGALGIDINNPQRIFDSGAHLNWGNYEFIPRTASLDSKATDEGVDVLSGRGVLVPLWVFKRVGSLRSLLLPHYIADFEFFARAKNAGIPLALTHRTRIKVHVEKTGLKKTIFNAESFKEVWDLSFSRRATNLFNHLVFIASCAPGYLKIPLLWRQVKLYAFYLLRTSAPGRWYRKVKS